MKAAVIQVLGQAPKYQEFVEPVAGENEILIQVHAAGLHPIVKAIASGAHYSADGQVPMVAGLDGVDAAGAGHVLIDDLVDRERREIGIEPQSPPHL